MAKTNKYEKYFVKGPKPGSWDQTCVVQLDEEVVPGAFFFLYTFQKPGYGAKGSHGPHQHDSYEILGFLGTDPDDQFNLGAEIVLYMGEEMEPCVINQSTLVYLPPNLVHCPLVYRRVDRPIVFLYSMPQALIQEKARPDLESRIPEADRANLFYPHEHPRTEPPPKK
jgi:hypothetical protein